MADKLSEKTSPGMPSSVQRSVGPGAQHEWQRQVSDAETWSVQCAATLCTAINDESQKAVMQLHACSFWALNICMLIHNL